MRLRLFLPGSLVVAALVLAACGGSSPKAGTSTGLDPRAILDQAAQKMNSVKYFHFKLTQENGTTPLPALPLNMQLVSAEGDVATPDRVQADVTAKAAGSNLKVKVIGIGNQSWLTNPFTRQWEGLPGDVSVRDIADPAGIVQGVIGQMQDVRLGGQEKVGDVQAYRIDGKTDSGSLAPTIASAEPGHPVDVQAWIGVSDGLPYRVRLSGPVNKDEAKNVVRTLELSSYDTAVDIKAP